MSVGGEERVDDGRWNNPPLQCSWCGSLMGYEETLTSTFVYVDGTVHLCYEDRLFVTTDALNVSGQLATDKATRDSAFSAYCNEAINPEESDRLDYPWY
jgi:hypothetical protein